MILGWHLFFFIWVLWAWVASGVTRRFRCDYLSLNILYWYTRRYILKWKEFAKLICIHMSKLFIHLQVFFLTFSSALAFLIRRTVAPSKEKLQCILIEWKKKSKEIDVWHLKIRSFFFFFFLCTPPYGSLHGSLVFVLAKKWHLAVARRSQKANTPAATVNPPKIFIDEPMRILFSYVGGY